MVFFSIIGKAITKETYLLDIDREIQFVYEAVKGGEKKIYLLDIDTITSDSYGLLINILENLVQMKREMLRRGFCLPTDWE